MTKKQRSAGRRHKDQAAQRQADISRGTRDIGPISPIADTRRRRRCERSLREFCETYNPATFYWPWSDDHLDIIQAIEQSVFHGALLAFAMPRGSGKTALCRMAVLWALACGHVAYVFLIGANEDKAVESLDAIKGWMRDLHPFVDDFPEISIPAKHIGGVANRAAGQIYLDRRKQEHSTMIDWGRTRIVLPRVPRPPNLRWKRGPLAPTSGSVIGVSGLTGEGIRGSLFAHPDGRQVRPDFVLLDDPQTDESAASPTQNATRERLIRGAVLGMAGPGKRISAVMPCTVIRPGDMVDRILDRKRNPLWRGVRRKLLPSLPANLAAWDFYWDVYRAAMGQTVPDIAPANAYYLEHRDELDAGAAAGWESRRAPDEISAIQHAMNLWCERGKEAFFAEFQNAPIDLEQSRARLTADSVAAKLNGLPPHVAPTSAQHLTAYVDVHARVLYYAVVAWEPDYGADLVDYGTHPRQSLGYFAQATAPRALADLYPGTTEDAWLQAGLAFLVDDLLAREFSREDGAKLRVAKLLVDAKWGEKTELVKAFCRRHPQAGRIVLPAMGVGLGPTRKALNDYRPEPGAQQGFHCRIPPPIKGNRIVMIDTNRTKSFAAGRLALPVGTPGGWELFGRDPSLHRLLADHLCAERPKELKATETNVSVDQWELQPNRENHWWDCLCGASAAASLLGVRPAGIESTRAAPAERKSLAEMAGRR